MSRFVHRDHVVFDRHHEALPSSGARSHGPVHNQVRGKSGKILLYIVSIGSDRNFTYY